MKTFLNTEDMLFEQLSDGETVQIATVKEDWPENLEFVVSLVDKGFAFKSTVKDSDGLNVKVYQMLVTNDLNNKGL